MNLPFRKPVIPEQVSVSRQDVIDVLDFIGTTRAGLREAIAVLESGRADDAAKKLRLLLGRMG